ncbi:MAG: rhomboid family intramembrane serine protease [Planctomycetota bacterium]|nr:rhomboid family intramembrane serine protease [Planctomycetota bacterium]
MDLPLLIQVASCRRDRAARELSLLLESRGFQHRVAQGLDGSWEVLVEETEAARAVSEIEAYRRENEAWTSRLAPHAQRPGAWLGSAWYGLLLMGFFAFQTDPNGAWRAGISDAGAILGGEWWLAVTALFLHADILHLCGNLVFGAVFGFLVAAEIGSGPAWLAILVAGGLGNGVNALLHAGIQGQEHRSLGASTGVFAAVGILSAIEWVRRRGAGDSGWRRLAPPVFGLVLLGLYGMGGERTDIGAHVFGFGTGALVGMLVALVRTRLVGRVANLAGWTAGVLVFLCSWLVWG